MFLEEKVAQLQKETVSRLGPSEELNTENQHLKFLMQEKDSDIRNLRQSVENYKLEIQNYTTALENKNRNIEMEGNELVKHFKQSNNRLQGQNQELMKELQDIRQKYFELQEQNNANQHVMFEKSQRFELLENTNSALEKEVADLMARLSIKEAPKVERLPEPVNRIQYQQDPYIMQKNDELSKELELALREEKKAKAELERMKAQELPQKPVDEEKNIKYDNLMNYLIKKPNPINRNSRNLVFLLLKQNVMINRLLRDKKEKEEMVLVNQKLEVVDGTITIYNDFSVSLVNFIYSIFKKSTDMALKKKLNSLIVFKENLIEMRGKANYMHLITKFFFRVKNLVYEELPRLKVVRYDKKDNPVESMLDFDKEHHEVENFHNNRQEHKNLETNLVKEQLNVSVKPVPFPISRTKREIENWVKRSLLSMSHRYKQEKEGWDKYLVYVFRLLAMKNRLDFPPKGGEPIQINPELESILNTKICTALLNFFNFQPKITKKVVKKKKKPVK